MDRFRPRAESFRKNLQADAPNKGNLTTNGQSRCPLKATNRQTPGKSEMAVGGNTAMDNSIASVKKNAPDSKVDDQTAA